MFFLNNSQNPQFYAYFCGCEIYKNLLEFCFCFFIRSYNVDGETVGYRYIMLSRYFDVPKGGG